jgi:hypothetical protein
MNCRVFWQPGWRRASIEAATVNGVHVKLVTMCGAAKNRLLDMPTGIRIDRQVRPIRMVHDKSVVRRRYKWK